VFLIFPIRSKHSDYFLLLNLLRYELPHPEYRSRYSCDKLGVRVWWVVSDGLHNNRIIHTLLSVMQRSVHPRSLQWLSDLSSSVHNKCYHNASGIYWCVAIRGYWSENCKWYSSLPL